VIREALIVIQKELAEMLGDWHSAYGALIQSAILIAICGVVVPADKPAVWLDPRSLVLLYGAFPAILAATFAADSFAGESERHTLETLLATPLAESAIFIGKLAAAILLALVGSALAVAAGLISATVSGGAFPRVGAMQILVLLAGAAAFASITAGLATQISLRLKVARAAQQMSSMLSVAVTAALAFLLRRMGVAVEWANLPRILVILVVLGIAVAYVGIVALRRESIFDPGRRKRSP
jgi:ABC-2 type transport system permease protein